MSLTQIDFSSIVVEKNVPLTNSASVGRVNIILEFISSMASGDSFTVIGLASRKNWVNDFRQAKVPNITKLIEKPVEGDDSTYVYRIWVYQNITERNVAKEQSQNIAYKGELK